MPTITYGEWLRTREPTLPPDDVIACGARPDVVLCWHCVDAYRNGIEPGATACDRRHDILTLREHVTYGDVDRLTDEQRATLAHSLRARPQTIELIFQPFGLPDGYVLARYADGFELGVSETGEGSS